MTRSAPHAADPTPDPTPQTTLPDNALVPVAPRQDGWTPARQRGFIEALAESGSVEHAARSVGMTATSAYRLRGRADAALFDAAWNAALERSVQQLLPAALDRALNGTLRQRWYHGALMGEERVYSDKLLIWLLEKGRAQLAGGEQRRAIAKNWHRAVEALENGETQPAPHIVDRQPLKCWWQGDRWVTNCPPPPGFRGYQNGDPDSDFYVRALTREEQAGRQRKRTLAMGSDEDDRRRFFGLA